ncbi:molybdopterin-guanine dinucleotide biosynthesis protein B [bacterium]|nr:molybdopterin-guanine dinucleotide biosynthesis protein B [bacterium]
METKLFSIVGRSGSGKTTLITRLIPSFVGLGLKVGSIKHTHHDVVLDKPGKDSWKHEQAGSSQVLLITNDRMALFGKFDKETSLFDISNQWFKGFDLVISEGFKNQDGLKIEVTRKENNRSPLFTNPDYNIQAIVSDYELESSLPVFDTNDTQSIFGWIRQQLGI